MKKMNYFKLFPMSAAALALAALTACGSAETKVPAADPAPSTAENALTSSEYAGTILLSVNPEIEMEYDKQGNVLTLQGCNDDGKAVLKALKDYEGKPCDAVIAQLVEQINKDGYFDDTFEGHEKNIVLKLERGSATPSDDFLEDLAEAVEEVVSAGHIGSQTMTLDDDDYDDVYGDKGYINAEAAKSLLSAQLGRNDLQFVEKEYDLDDGDYEVEFVLDGVEYEYEVNAVTGKVTEMEAEAQDDRYDDDRDDLDDVHDDDWDDDKDDVYDDDWDDDKDDVYDDDRDDDKDDVYDDAWDDDKDDVYDDDRDDDKDDVYDDAWDDDKDDVYDDDRDDDKDDVYDDAWDDDKDDVYDDDHDDDLDDDTDDDHDDQDDDWDDDQDDNDDDWDD